MVNFFSYFLTCSNTSTVNDVVGNHIFYFSSALKRSKKGHQEFCLVSQLHGVNSEISNTLCVVGHNVLSSSERKQCDERW